jgi:hypothetical protein
MMQGKSKCGLTPIRPGKRGMELRKTLLALLASVVLCGCITGSDSNRIEVRKGPVFAKGVVRSASREELDWVELDVGKSQGDPLTNMWVEVQSTEKATLTSITPKFLKEKGAADWKGPDRTYGGTATYYLRGYAFCFDGERLIAFKANRSGFPPGKREAKPRLGLVAGGASLTLPCSLPEFESVFGKPDDVTRGWAW